MRSDAPCAAAVRVAVRVFPGADYLSARQVPEGFILAVRSRVACWNFESLRRLVQAMKYFVLLLFACSTHLAPVAAPASMPASQPASAPVDPPEGLFVEQPNGDSCMTRASLQTLTAHIIRQRATSDKKLADCSAREFTAKNHRSVADANAAQSAWRAQWVPVLTGIGGAAFAAVVETLVIWGLDEVKPKQR
jgi:hypothetical protein